MGPGWVECVPLVWVLVPWGGWQEHLKWKDFHPEFWGDPKEMEYWFNSFSRIIKSSYGSQNLETLRHFGWERASNSGYRSCGPERVNPCERGLKRAERNQKLSIGCGAEQAMLVRRNCVLFGQLKHYWSGATFLWTPGAARDFKPCYGTRFCWQWAIVLLYYWGWWAVLIVFMLKVSLFSFIFCKIKTVCFYQHGWLLIQIPQISQYTEYRMMGIY